MLPEVLYTGQNASSEQTDTSDISWKSQAIQRDDLPKSLKEGQIKVSTDSPTDQISSNEDNSADNEQTVPEIIPKTTLPPAPKNIDPDVFLGKSAKHLASELGTPTILRREAAVEVWQYQLSSCVIDFYFFGGSETRAVKYTHMRSPFLGGMIDYAVCMIDLYQFSQTSGTSR